MPAIALPYQPRAAFLPYHNRKARWSTLVCHRRSGKTVAAVNDLIIGALECTLNRPQLAYIAPNYQQAKRIAWEYVKEYAAPLIDSSHESELRIQLKGNGARIYLLGAEKADSLRGLYLDGVAVDEFAQIRPSTVSQVILPCLSDRSGWMTLMGTPMGKNHFYDAVKRSQGDPAWFHMTLKASTSGIISPEELAIIKSQMDASDYEQEYECSFEAALRGAIYGVEMELAEQEGRIHDFPVDEALPVDCVLDLGYTDDTVITFFQHAREGISINEILVNNETEWDYYLDEMETRDVRTVWLPHDARAKNLQTGRSIVEQTLRRGFKVDIVPDHKLRDGIAALRKLLPFMRWNNELCSGGVEAMKSYRRIWDDKLGCYRDRPAHDWASHVADCLRYLGVIYAKLPAPKSRLVLPKSYARDPNYGFSLEDLFANRLTNPALRREEF